MIWKSDDYDVKRKYDFTYDTANKILKGVLLPAEVFHLHRFRSFLQPGYPVLRDKLCVSREPAYHAFVR